MTVSFVPFYEYHVSRNVSSRTFVTKDEFLTRKLQAVKALPRGSFLIKTPTSQALLLNAPFVAVRKLSAAVLARAKAQIFSADFYHSVPLDPEIKVITAPPKKLLKEPDKWRD